MKRFNIALITFFTILLATTVHASDTKSINISGEVVQPISIKNVVSMTGWKVTKPTTGSCVYQIDQSTVVDQNNSANDCTVISSSQSGQFEVQGANQMVSLQYTKTSFGDSGITLKSFSDDQGGSLSSNGSFQLQNGSEVVNVSAKVEVKDSVSVGSHQAVVDVTATYQ